MLHRLLLAALVATIATPAFACMATPGNTRYLHRTLPKYALSRPAVAELRITSILSDNNIRAVVVKPYKGSFIAGDEVVIDMRGTFCADEDSAKDWIGRIYTVAGTLRYGPPGERRLIASY